MRASASARRSVAASRRPRVDLAPRSGPRTGGSSRRAASPRRERGAEAADEEQPRGEADRADDRAVVPNTRPRTPLRWSMPAARRTRIHARSRRLRTASPANSATSSAQNPSRMPQLTLSVRYWTCDATHSAPAGIGPQNRRLRTIMSARSAWASSVSARRRPRPPRSGGAPVPGRRGARPPADEQAAGVGRVRAHCVEGYGEPTRPTRARARGASCPTRSRSSSSSVKPVGGERVEQPRQPGDVAELVGHRRAVEVGAERDVLDADAVGDVADVGGDRARAACRRRRRRRRAGTATAKTMPTRPPEAPIASSCASVRLRDDGARARGRRSARRSAARRSSRATSQKPASLRWLRSTRDAELRAARARARRPRR